VGKEKQCWSGGVYLLLGLVLSAAFITYLEITHPYTYLGSDNFTQDLPALLAGFKQLFSGKIPYFNMHQLAGVPLLETGVYTFLYPITILSYVLSHYVFGNDFLLMEIFTIIHLLLGYVAMFVLLRKMKTGDVLAAYGALAYVFSGYNLLMPRGAYSYSPICFFLPLIFYLQVRNVEAPSKKNTLWLGLARGLFVHSGYLQFFIYSAFFEFLFLLLISGRIGGGGKKGTKRKSRRNILELPLSPDRTATFTHYLISLVVTVIIGIPIFVMIAALSTDNIRGGAFALVRYVDTHCRFAVHPIDFIFGNILPLPHGNALESLFIPVGTSSNLSFTGGLCFIFGIVAAVGLLRKYRRTTWVRSPFLSLMVISAILSWGCFGLVSLIMIVVPIWNKMFISYKFAVFTNFFVIVFGSLALRSFFGPDLTVRRKRFLYAALALSLCLIFLFLQNPVAYPHTYWGGPFPLDEGRFEDLKDGRIISYVTKSEFDEINVSRRTSTLGRNDALAMQNNFPSYYGLYGIGGYEPLQSTLQGTSVPLGGWGVSGRVMNSEWLSAWGIKYLFIPYESLPYHSELQKLTVIKDIVEERILVLENPQAMPIVFCDSGSIDYELLDNGVRFVTAGVTEKACTVSIVYNPNFVLEIDGQREQYIYDDFGRMTLTLSPGAHEVELTYRNPLFIPSLLISALLAALFFLFYSPLKRFTIFGVNFLERYWWVLIVFLGIVLLLSAVKVVGQFKEVLPLQDATGCVLGENLNMDVLRQCIKDSLKRDLSVQRAALEEISQPIVGLPD